MATMDQIQGLNEALAAIRQEIEKLQTTVFSNGDIQNKIAEGARTLDSSNSTQHLEIRKFAGPLGPERVGPSAIVYNQHSQHSS